MPGAQHRDITGYLRSESRVGEEDYERRAGNKPLEPCDRLRAEVPAALPRSRLGVDEHNALSAPGYRVSRGAHAEILQRLLKYVTGRDRVGTTHVIINGGDRNRRTEVRFLAPHQMQRASNRNSRPTPRALPVLAISHLFAALAVHTNADSEWMIPRGRNQVLAFR